MAQASHGAGGGAAHGATANQSAIEVRGVSMVFGTPAGEVRALDDVSVSIARNEFFTLLGPSGCGKTTLLRLIAGFEQPTTGHILLHGAPIEHLPPHRRPVNTVFQSYALFPHMSVAENVGFGLEMKGRPRRERDARVQAMLALVQLSGFEGRRPSQLSGGQQQRVALARALASEPEMLLLDEPLSALDMKLRKDMQIELKRIQRETGITFVFVTHDQAEALTMSDRIAVMSAGKILQVGSPREIYDHPARRFVADFIGETNFLEARLSGREGGREARYQLANGAHVVAPALDGLSPGAPVTLAVRPERVELGDPDAPGALAGEIQEVVYAGVDTTYHVALRGGGGLRARVQNRTGGAPSREAGARVAVLIEPSTIQILVE
ncbi:ABC transporter ATP-binding protein [Sorangium sp. So ce131]|uniref:ABC transporter ATP-binding protein n=1 Tax=Sorangium sp. So ce131 TaxID=3133282 RepID=UPI003F622217